MELINKKQEPKKKTEENIEVLGQPTKKRKVDPYLNSMERLDG
jgi:hypothetical protein